MKVFVAGATGVLGRRVTGLLVADGHHVTAIARTEQKAEMVRRLGAAPVAVDLFDAEGIAHAAEGHDAVCNLATNIPSPTEAALAGAWAANDRVRREGSRVLAEATLRVGATRFVQESVAFVYADGGDAWIDEDFAIDLDPRMRSVIDAEANASRVTDAGGAGVALRFGLFVSPDDPYSEFSIERTRRGRPGVLGSPEDYMATVHADDAASAVVAALGANAGVYNVCLDEPPRRREFVDALSDALGAGRVTFEAASATPDREYLARSQRVSNRRFKIASGWRPSYPSVSAVWDAVISARDAG